MFNAYQFGGYLIFSGIAPYIDGRAELYGDEFLTHYIDAVRLKKDELSKLLERNGITWTILPTESAAVTLMDHLPGWHRFFSDTSAVVHIRSVL